MASHSSFRRRLARSIAVLWLTGPVAAQTIEAKPAASAAAREAAAPKTSEHPLTPKEMREAQIAADTERLYELAQQLKVELDKSTKDTLSLAVVKKAAEIEKLAHSIGERMKSN